MTKVYFLQCFLLYSSLYWQTFGLVYTIEIMLYLFSFLKKYSLYTVLRKYSLNKAFIALIKTPIFNCKTWGKCDYWNKIWKWNTSKIKKKLKLMFKWVFFVLNISVKFYKFLLFYNDDSKVILGQTYHGL